ncbi:hypothetical protein [Ileibacterium valens]|uniref:hypothetical protein n=1 Tax=Ileibacterium valens TaxID=1862668 RepID=UPI00272DC746|nr:hypothetical protein [Ileibacterium valens]
MELKSALLRFQSLNTKKIDYAQALAPAKESKEVNQTIEEQGLKVSLEKIEFADKETSST